MVRPCANRVIIRRGVDLGFEFQKQTKAKHGYDGQYTLFMRSRLGATRFNALVKRAKKKLTLTREYLEQLITDLNSSHNIN